MKKAGIFIIIIGLVLTIFTAVTFFTRERVAKIGTVKSRIFLSGKQLMAQLNG